MKCPHCASLKVSNRSRLTRHGYKTFFCRNCRHTFNERTGTPFNRSRIQTNTLFKVLLWRLRFKLSLADLAEMFGVEIAGFYFSREAIRLWEAKFAPLITDILKGERKGQATTRWKVDETLLKIKGKYHYLYRAIDNKGQLVATKLSPVRTLQSTTAFFEEAVETVGHQPQQVTTDKEVTYPGAIQKVLGRKVEHRTGRYLNNRMEQDHRGIKGRYKPMGGFKNAESGARFSAAYDEQREFFKFRRWHKDKRSSGGKRADFKSKFFQLKNKFLQSKLVWKQAVMPI